MDELEKIIHMLLSSPEGSEIEGDAMKGIDTWLAERAGTPGEADES